MKKIIVSSILLLFGITLLFIPRSDIKAQTYEDWYDIDGIYDMRYDYNSDFYSVNFGLNLDYIFFDLDFYNFINLNQIQPVIINRYNISFESIIPMYIRLDVSSNKFVMYDLSFSYIGSYNLLTMIETYGKSQDLLFMINDIIYSLGDVSYQEAYDVGFNLGFQNAKNQYYDSRYNLGLQHGKNEGFDIGYQEGQNDGYDLGLQQGLTDGKNIGRIEGKEDYGIYTIYGWETAYNYGERKFIEGQNSIDPNDLKLHIYNFLPGVLGSIFLFFFQITSISFLGISLLQIIGIILSIGAIFLIIKFFLK